MLEGKVGRMYLPQQGVDKIALHKMKVQPWAADFEDKFPHAIPPLPVAAV